MSWPWIVLLALGVLLVVAAEWPRVSGMVGADARRRRERERRKAKLRVVSPEDAEGEQDDPRPAHERSF